MGRLLMGIQGGVSGNIADVDAQFQALKTSMRPLNYSPGGGYYRIAKNFVVGPGATIAANGGIFSFRWTSATKIALVVFFRWHWVVTTAFTGGQYIDHALYIARSWSSDDTGTNTAALTMTGNNAKKRTSMVTSSAGQILYATSNSFTAGTRTLDANPLMYKGNWGSAQGFEPVEYTSLSIDVDHEHPIVLATNEGLVLNNITVFPVAGVLQMSVEMAWAEVLNASF